MSEYSYTESDVVAAYKAGAQHVMGHVNPDIDALASLHVQKLHWNAGAAANGVSWFDVAKDVIWHPKREEL